MAPTPDWKRYLDAGMQFTEMRRSQARRIAIDLADAGQVAKDQVAGTVDEILAMSRRRTDELRAFVQAEVQRQLGALGLATKADLERLERKLSAAAKGTKKAPAKKAPAKSATKAGAKATKKATTTAEKAPRKKAAAVKAS